MAPTRIRAILFDLDGTLVDSRIDVADAINHALAELGLAMFSREEIFRFVGNGIERSFRRLFTARVSGKVLSEQAPDLYQEGLRLYRAYYSQHLLDHTTPFPEVNATLAALGGRAKAVITNKRQEPSVAILKGLGLLDHFQTVIGGDRVGAKKPAPDAVLVALQALDAGPEETVLVGDSPDDVAAARAVGVLSVGAAYGYHGREPLVEAGADRIIDRPGELLQLFA